MIRQAIFLLGCMTLLTGCISFEYDGEAEADGPAEVAVYDNAANVRRAYRVFGRAAVSGDYSDVSRDRLLNKLKSEAEDRGADAILLTEQQVVPKSESRSVHSRFSTGADYDGEGSLRQLRRDVDLNYGRYGGSLENVSTNARYIRVIKAEFLKFTDAKPQAFDVVEPEKKTE